MFTDESIDRESQEKLYMQVFSILKGKIEKGEWNTGEKIPTENELCQSYSVSKATVRIAVQELVRNGFLKKWQGKGTFVTSTTPGMGIAMTTRLTEEMFGEGISIRKEIIEKGVIKPDEDIRGVFRTEEDIYYILCRRMADGEPAYIDESFIPMELFPDIGEEDVCALPFYDLVQRKARRRVHKVIQNIEIMDIDRGRAKLLGVPEGRPVLSLHRLLVGPEGCPVAYTRLYGSGRKYRLQTEFERVK